MRNTCSHRGLVDRGVRHTGEDGGSTLFMMSVVLHDDDVDNVFVAQQADRVRVHVHSHCGLVDRRIHHNREDSGSAVVRTVFCCSCARARACVCVCVCILDRVMMLGTLVRTVPHCARLLCQSSSTFMRLMLSPPSLDWTRTVPLAQMD